MPGVNCVVARPVPTEENSLDWMAGKAQGHIALLTRNLPHLRASEKRFGDRALTITLDHPGYGITSIVSGDWTLHLECQTQDVNIHQIARELDAEDLEHLDETGLRNLWSRVFSRLKGSWFCLALNPRLKLLVFANDALARLPVYLSKTEAGLFVGRDIGLARALCPSARPNPLYLALYQIFCYVPGRGSCFDEIDTLRSATIAVYNWGRDELKVSDCAELRFVEPLGHGAKTKRLGELVESFLEVVKGYRLEDKLLLALSGGFDSRAVAAALSRARISFRTLTYLDADRTATDDCLIAGQIAQTLGCPHQQLTLRPESPDLYHSLFAVKQGMNYLGMSFFLDFLQRLAGGGEPAGLMLTGDGGDKVFPCLTAEVELPDGRSLLKHLYRQHAFFHPRIAAASFGLTQQVIDSYLLDLVKGYPGSGYAVKYKWFLLAERSGRWLTEGEDRNRHFVRSETPFLDPAFYQGAMRIPDEWKKGNAFYSMFIQILSPELNKIRLANNPIIPKYLANGGYQVLLSQMRRIRSSLESYRPGSGKIPQFKMQGWIIDTLSGKYQDSPVLNELMPGKILADRESLKKMNRPQLNILLTLAAMITGKVD